MSFLSLLQHGFDESTLGRRGWSRALWLWHGFVQEIDKITKVLFIFFIFIELTNHFLRAQPSYQQQQERQSRRVVFTSALVAPDHPPTRRWSVTCTCASWIYVTVTVTVSPLRHLNSKHAFKLPILHAHLSIDSLQVAGIEKSSTS
jgi:hypothetical protein